MTGPTRRRWLLGAAAGLTAVAVAACGTTSAELPPDARPLPPATTGPAAPTSRPSAAPTAPGTPTPVVPPSGATCADGLPVRSSLAPLGPNPPPGAFRAGSTMKRIVDRGYLNVAIVTDAPPVGSMNWRKLELEGFDVDVAKTIAKALFGSAEAERIHFQPVQTNQRNALIMDDADPAHPDADTATDSRSGIDIVVATYTITCQRKEKILFSGAYFESGFQLLVPKDAGFDSIDDFVGFTVCSTDGSTSIEKLRQAAAWAGRRTAAAAPSGSPARGLTVIGRPRAADCLVAVQQGDADAVATDNVILAGMARQDEYLRVESEAFNEVFGTELETLAEPYGVALWRSGDQAQDDEFVRFVNGALRDWMAGGGWADSYDHWFRDALGPRSTPLADDPSWPLDTTPR
ncbi:transporter substrate-binding domain-containing protein [Frankia sp. CNm7]|uniref:Transporter substrate-binding domain-containing protein n=1 Tax=Frankia nepalensis TaxID=1836974 RepID=A0A937UNQ0_9ACTN|nr:transporter substrate-binding domain-containing protein [Frankia nepalensis]MBL7501215.1 transporter substrate-binding domain-containing protein [Frankia nepalensis]MBL7513510.1 transporter substrate-binding domain-containing protein [Frankia nepalensis]MBL7524134.1 transporter substrate-binding domain-containing protein [Frankia nepalensis]MBL7628217.1 transporter substrate-binding domain-containing protein [Frankia nepalensis]